MAIQKRASNDDGLMAEINITPLVDVMLVLLVIFIVTAPLIVPQSIKVNLPKTEALAQQGPTPMVQLQVSADGQLLLQEQALTLSQLADSLRQRASDPAFHLQVLADEQVPYGVMAKVMSVAQSSGATKLSFVTLPQ
jgi:biopolymer transport protein ExbD